IHMENGCSPEMTYCARADNAIAFQKSRRPEYARRNVTTATPVFSSMSNIGIARKSKNLYAAATRKSKTQFESFHARFEYCENSPVRGIAWFSSIQIPVRKCSQTSEP